MGSVPAYAAINQTVELAKHRHRAGAGALVNAVLRRVDRDRAASGVDALAGPPPADRVDRLALEMAAHEDDERAALDAELGALAAAWREAEEIAAIADAL